MTHLDWLKLIYELNNWSIDHQRTSVNHAKEVSNWALKREVSKRALNSHRPFNFKFKQYWDNAPYEDVEIFQPNEMSGSQLKQH